MTEAISLVGSLHFLLIYGLQITGAPMNPQDFREAQVEDPQDDTVKERFSLLHRLEDFMEVP